MNYSWCGLILHNLRDSLHSKLYGHGLKGKTNQNSPITNINNQQQISQISTSHHLQNGQRGDYGSLPLGHGGHHNYSNSGRNNGYSTDLSYYDSHHHRAGGVRGDLDSGMSSHQIMKQESFKRRDNPKFGYHHDINMFGNTQGGSGVPFASSSSSSTSSSVSTSSSKVGGASTSASSSSSSSS